MTTKVQRNLKAIKRMNKNKKLRTTTPSHYSKLLKDDLMQDDAENVCNVN
jgi:hypothetical protein